MTTEATWCPHCEHVPPTDDAREAPCAELLEEDGIAAEQGRRPHFDNEGYEVR